MDHYHANPINAANDGDKNCTQQRADDLPDQTFGNGIESSDSQKEGGEPNQQGEQTRGWRNPIERTLHEQVNDQTQRKADQPAQVKPDKAFGQRTES